ncbi:glycosyltransferase family 49 protein [Gonapodya prolifera JEL478]|uniref:Glycosyltransferase family 49 protein n=1 Tax=Gonapodya prolifera (strain JEL478) TaxID=1344416 RepID=A0A138ZZT4_GONPJ|nr:glycosyltransferase family 49 protein [Gonapodya prolifera JEL478]|eukprot:KXS10026.1 glycosyltransferase family 49 protein [Gonapodya prolifera JEL478]
MLRARRCTRLLAVLALFLVVLSLLTHQNVGSILLLRRDQHRFPRLKRGHTEIDSSVRHELNISASAPRAVVEYKTVPLLTAPSQSRHESDVTIFTQLSLDRLDRLEMLATLWEGPISVALYIDDLPKNASLVRVVEDIKKTLQPVANGRMVLTVVLGPHFVAPSNLTYHPYDILYPINHLRNLALKQCTTEFVFSIDVDFLPSEGLYKALMMPQMLEWMRSASEGRVAVFVIPAFELTSKITGPQNFTRNRFSVLCSAGVLVPFHSRQIIPRETRDPEKVDLWCRGNLSEYHVKITETHALTNYPMWLSNPPLPYLIPVNPRQPSRKYEPYYISRRDQLPSFDERFRGYSFNKRLHSIELQYRGVQFWVLPQGALKGDVKAEVGRLYNQALNELRRRFLENDHIDEGEMKDEGEID